MYLRNKKQLKDRKQQAWDLRTEGMPWQRIPQVFFILHIIRLGNREPGNLETLVDTDKKRKQSNKKRLLSLDKGTERGQPNKTETLRQ